MKESTETQASQAQLHAESGPQLFEMNGRTYVQRGDVIAMIDHDTYCKFCPGTAVHGYYRQRIAKEKPLPESQRVKIINALIEELKTLI